MLFAVNAGALPSSEGIALDTYRNNDSRGRYLDFSRLSYAELHVLHYLADICIAFLLRPAFLRYHCQRDIHDCIRQSSLCIAAAVHVILRSVSPLPCMFYNCQYLFVVLIGIVLRRCLLCDALRIQEIIVLGV